MDSGAPPDSALCAGREDAQGFMDPGAFHVPLQGTFVILGRGDVEANKHRALSDLAMGASQNQMKIFGDYFGGKEDNGGSSGLLNLLAAFLGG